MMARVGSIIVHISVKATFPRKKESLAEDLLLVGRRGEGVSSIQEKSDSMSMM